MMPVRTCHAGIAGDERGVQGLRKGNVHRIVRGQRMPQLPDPAKEHLMRVSHKGEVPEVLKRLASPRVVELAPVGEAAEDLGHLDVEQVGRAQLIVRTQEALRAELTERGA